MRRWLGNRLIRLAYTIEPKLATELRQYIEALCTQVAANTAQAAAQEATAGLLAYQQRARDLASMQ